MALSHCKPQTKRMARFMAASACMSGVSPFTWDSTGGPHAEMPSFDATGCQLRVLVHTQTRSESTRANPITEALQSIRTTFGLTMEMLADACGVTRKAVYKWLDDGVVPNRQHQRRIFRLREAALNWRREAYPYPKSHLHEPIMRKKTLLDLLNEDPVDVERILLPDNA